MFPHARHTCLHFRHASAVEPQTSHVSGGGSAGDGVGASPATQPRPAALGSDASSSTASTTS